MMLKVKYYMLIKFHFLPGLILLFGILFFNSCKEDPIPDTIYPKDYFPVYPGSWWLYSNGELKTTSSGYVLHVYEADIASPYETEETFVPYWDGHFVYGYSITQNSTEFPLKQMLHESKNEVWVVGRFEGVDILRKTTSKDISVDIVQYPYNDPENCDTLTDLIEVYVSDSTWEMGQVPTCANLENCDTVFIEDPDNGIIYPLFYEWQMLYDYDTIFDITIINCDSIRTYDSVIVVREYIEDLDFDTCWISKEYYAKNIGLIKREIGSCADGSVSMTDFEIIKYFINKPK